MLGGSVWSGRRSGFLSGRLLGGGRHGAGGGGDAGTDLSLILRQHTFWDGVGTNLGKAQEEGEHGDGGVYRQHAVVVIGGGGKCMAIAIGEAIYSRTVFLLGCT